MFSRFPQGSAESALPCGKRLNETTMAKRKPTTAETVAESAEYTVLARRYRPQAFDDLVGQEPVAQSLTNAIQTNRVAHAYLFTGARGVGKTSTARILAKCLNCEKGPTPTPCNQCDFCKAISTGDDIDVLEIDGASNRGIDEVRELRQNVQFRPSRARYKIYIIDEVHMLTREAFNALLKTLEEPPPHVKFIFATTEVQKIPVTILSRCQRFDFAGIGMQQIIQRLREITDQEKMKADDNALELIARRAAGSMRDAQSLLDQLLAFASEKLTVAQVHQLLGTANEEKVAELASAILDHDPKKTLDSLNRFIEEGLQLGEFLDQLTDYWRDLMIARCTGAENQIFSVSGSLRDALYKQSQAIELETILAGLDILSTAKARLRSTIHGRAILEMAVVRLCRLENLISLAQLAQALDAGTPAPRPAPPSKPAATSLTAALEEKKKVEPAENGVATPLSEANLEQIWSRTLTEVGPFLANELRKIDSVAIFGPNALAIRFPIDYDLSGNTWDTARRARIEEVLRKITGHTCSLRIETVSSISPAGAAPQASEPAESPQSRSRRQRAEILKQPLLNRAVELLGAQVVHMDEGFDAASGESAASAVDTSEAEEM